jgi:hypothetical protein
MNRDQFVLALNRVESAEGKFAAILSRVWQLASVCKVSDF